MRFFGNPSKGPVASAGQLANRDRVGEGHNYESLIAKMARAHIADECT